MAQLDESIVAGQTDHIADHERLAAKANYVADVTDFASPQAAVDAVEAAGGGVVLYPPGTYTDIVTVDTNVPVLFSGYGATVTPAYSEAAITVDSGNGDTAAGVTVQGFRFDGGSVGETIGVRVVNTDRVRIRDCRFDDLAEGVRLFTESSGWVEGTTIQNCFVDGCGYGVLFFPYSGTSFGETLLLDVGFNNCGTALRASSGADLYRSRLLGVTIWLNDNQTGWMVGGNMNGVTGQVGFETTGSPTGDVCVDVLAAAANLDRATLELTFTGSLSTKVQTAGPDLIWSEGPMWGLALAGQQPAGWAMYGDTWPRTRVENELPGGGGFSFGPGDGDVDVSLGRYDTDVLYTPDTLRVGGDVHHVGSGVGFYDTAPVAQQTGVAVSAAAIHAALVNLGLITA